MVYEKVLVGVLEQGVYRGIKKGMVDLSNDIGWVRLSRKNKVTFVVTREVNFYVFGKEPLVYVDLQEKSTVDFKAPAHLKPETEEKIDLLAQDRFWKAMGGKKSYLVGNRYVYVSGGRSLLHGSILNPVMEQIENE